MCTGPKKRSFGEGRGGFAASILPSFSLFCLPFLRVFTLLPSCSLFSLCFSLFGFLDISVLSTSLIWCYVIFTPRFFFHLYFLHSCYHFYLAYMFYSLHFNFYFYKICSLLPSLLSFCVTVFYIYFLNFNISDFHLMPLFFSHGAPWSSFTFSFFLRVIFILFE